MNRKKNNGFKKNVKIYCIKIKLIYQEKDGLYKKKNHQGKLTALSLKEVKKMEGKNHRNIKSLLRIPLLVKLMML